MTTRSTGSTDRARAWAEQQRQTALEHMVKDQQRRQAKTA